MKHIFKEATPKYYGADFDDIVGDVFIEDGIVIAGNYSYVEKGNPELIEIVKDATNAISATLDLYKKTNKPYKVKEICGYSQGEWNRIYFPADTDQSVIDYLDTLYFGKYDVYIDDDGIEYEVPHTVCWKGKDFIKNFLKGLTEYEEDDIIVSQIVNKRVVYDYE